MITKKLDTHGSSLDLRRLSVLDHLGNRLLARHLKSLRKGGMFVHEMGDHLAFEGVAELQANLRIHRPRFYRRAAFGGSLALAESYIQGDWDSDDLVSLMRIFARTQDSQTVLDRSLARLTGIMHRAIHWARGNSRTGSRRNIHAHYDVGNDFFRLWLDETMAYSCAIFPAPGASLTKSSVEKFDRICRSLELRSSDHLLEIGTGWGGFAIHAAKEYGCRVTTTTISREQFELATRRIEDAGLSDRVAVVDRDYRALSGQFDKLVSIEMIEAVGHEHLDDYFRQCGRLLHGNGSLVLQAIVMPDRHHARYLRSLDFIRRYVFPGGCLPSLGSILASVSRVSDLGFVSAQDYSPHYAETLRRWRIALNDRLHEAREMGYSHEFLRLWNYYLCYCEAAFTECRVGVLQIRLDKPGCRRGLYSPTDGLVGERRL